MPVTGWKIRLLVIGLTAGVQLSAAADEGPLGPILSGRVQYDISHVDLPGGTSENDQTLRRFRLGVSDELDFGGTYKAEVNINDAGDVTITSAFVDLHMSGDHTVRFGQDKTPNSLDEMTSSTALVFAERPTFTDTFELDRRFGISLGREDEPVSYRIGLYGGNLNESAFSGEYAIAARVYNTRQLTRGAVHFGLSGRLREAGGRSIAYEVDDPSRWRAAAAPDRKEVRRDRFLGGEAAATWDRYWAAGEIGVIGRGAGGPVSYAEGGYVAGGVMFGGRRRLQNGKFLSPRIVRPVDRDGHGAVGVSARYDRIDLAEVNLDRDETEIFNISVDWWLNDHAHLMLTGFQSRSEISATGTTLTGNSATARGWTMRFQVSF